MFADNNKNTGDANVNNFFSFAVPTLVLHYFLYSFFFETRFATLLVYLGDLCVQAHQQRIGNSSKLKRTPTIHAIYIYADAHVISFLNIRGFVSNKQRIFTGYTANSHGALNVAHTKKSANIRAQKNYVYTLTKNVPRTIVSACMLFALAHISSAGHKNSCCMTSGEQTSNDIYFQRENDKAHGMA